MVGERESFLLQNFSNPAVCEIFIVHDNNRARAEEVELKSRGFVAAAEEAEAEQQRRVVNKSSPSLAWPFHRRPHPRRRLRRVLSRTNHPLKPLKTDWRNVNYQRGAHTKDTTNYSLGLCILIPDSSVSFVASSCCC